MSDTPMAVPARLLPLAIAPLPTVDGAPPKRRPGRPLGSRNRPKEGEVNPPQSLGGSRAPRTPPAPPTSVEEEAAAKVKFEKQLRAAQYAELIHKELNDELFTFLIGMRIVPAELIYKNGHIPPTSQPDPNLTEAGNQIAIPTDVAKNWGKLLAELSYTPMGKTVVGASQNNMAGVAIAAVMALYSTYRYTQQLKPFLDFVKAQQAAAARAAEGSDDNSEQQ